MRIDRYDSMAKESVPEIVRMDAKLVILFQSCIHDTCFQRSKGFAMVDEAQIARNCLRSNADQVAHRQNATGEDRLRGGHREETYKKDGNRFDAKRKE
ncbi:hypothetical protein BWQ96_04633 [Gracilariopsis chorda]|uniref:Uncharacterized protein n=1 Tax=Gracilariopsis chorda TaxID=448386 RepID=A0A2V3IU16_9FLOR|nr:hypothetical protein BWQ96_04633 [Gracilariopsis chorda]|eukprot:PXF45628.1 hypothetical protein BWQ96_04633 [Gracilariopsis chorda]